MNHSDRGKAVLAVLVASGVVQVEVGGEPCQLGAGQSFAQERRALLAFGYLYYCLLKAGGRVPPPRQEAWTSAQIASPHVVRVTDIDVLATILQHTEAVVVNAGTVLLDALVNDRPAVCVLYDEGAPPGESWAAKSVIGEHYRDVAESGAFHEARSFEEVTAGVERCLASPGELEAERRAVRATVVGPVDGRSAERVVDALLDRIGA
jgi:hypothetical protein